MESRKLLPLPSGSVGARHWYLHYCVPHLHTRHNNNYYNLSKKLYAHEIIHCEPIDKYFEMKFFFSWMFSIIENVHIDSIIVHLYFMSPCLSVWWIKDYYAYLLFHYYWNFWGDSGGISLMLLYEINFKTRDEHIRK